jgi:GntR family transcriptional regulator
MYVQPNNKILKQRGIALYAQLIEEIKEMIAQKQLQPGDALPTEEQMRANYGVSRSTIRDALSELEREHRIERRQGIGTFVARPPLKRDLQLLTGFTEDMTARNLKPSSQVLAYEKPALGILPDELSGIETVRVIRLRLSEGRPFGLHDTLIPAEIAANTGFTPERLAQNQSLSFYASLEAAGYVIEEGREHLSAEIANPLQAQHLMVKPGVAMIKVVRLSWSLQGQLLEHVTALYLPEQYDYVIRLKRR